MEPLLPEDRQELEDLATDLVAKANTLAGRLHPVMRASVGDLVRSMNCYYSNLIEGHNTLPIDIDRALNDDLAKEPERRNLQLEARAHIEVQRMIDRSEATSPALSVDFIIWTHKNFCERLPEELLVVDHPTTKEKIKIVPGELRKDHVKVGFHIPPATGRPSHLPKAICRRLLREAPFETTQDYRRCRVPPSLGLDTPVSGRQRPRDAAVLTRTLTGVGCRL
ncbi:hypothetical protein ACNJYC_10600 [Bradyrhizobium sp. DASA03007]